MLLIWLVWQSNLPGPMNCQYESAMGSKGSDSTFFICFSHSLSDSLSVTKLVKALKEVKTETKLLPV